MKLTPEQLAKWKALVPELNNDADDHMGVAHSIDMPPHHTVNFRHAKNAHEAAWAITNLIADLEEATAIRGNGVLVPAPRLEEMQAELRALRQQLAEAQARECPNLEPVINWLVNGCDPQEAANELRIYQRMYHSPDGARAALQATIAEAVEPYRKDAARWKELLSRLGDDSGPTIVKIEGWSDEYPGYAWFADLTQEQVIAELDTAIAAKGEENEI